MRFFALAIGAVQGLFAVGLLALLQAVVQAFRPEWTLPFSIWWGMVLCLPAVAMSAFFGRAKL